jgi:hypothetical protein
VGRACIVAPFFRTILTGLAVRLKLRLELRDLVSASFREPRLPADILQRLVPVGTCAGSPSASVLSPVRELRGM